MHSDEALLGEKMGIFILPQEWDLGIWFPSVTGIQVFVVWVWCLIGCFTLCFPLIFMSLLVDLSFELASVEVELYLETIWLRLKIYSDLSDLPKHHPEFLDEISAWKVPRHHIWPNRSVLNLDTGPDQNRSTFSPDELLTTLMQNWIPPF